MIKSIKAINSEAILDISQRIINKRFGAIGFMIYVSGSNIIRLEDYDATRFDQKIPQKFLMIKPDTNQNISKMIEFLGEIELLVSKLAFGKIFIKVTVVNGLPYRHAVLMTTKTRKYKTKKK